MSTQTSRWKPMIDEWVARERRLHPGSPIREDSVTLRDAVEIDSHAYVLVSYDVDVPWPQEEDTAAEGRSQNAAVIEAVRVDRPWIEQDAARALAQLRTEDGMVSLNEHLLGPRRVYSGTVGGGVDRVQLRLEDGTFVDAQVIDGWMLAVLPNDGEAIAVTGFTADQETFSGALRHDHFQDMIDDVSFTRTAGRSMYFSPLDLRGVIPLVQWERASGLVVVGVCLEHYDEGGVLRLRIDGVRRDDDLMISWPNVTVEVAGQQIASAICGETSFADTVSMDIGFRPWLSPDADQLKVTVSDLRGIEGPAAPIELTLAVPRQGR